MIHTISRVLLFLFIEIIKGGILLKRTIVKGLETQDS